MGLFSKIKDILFEDEEVSETEAKNIEKKEVKKVEPSRPIAEKIEPQRKVEPKIEPPLREQTRVSTPNSNVGGSSYTWSSQSLIGK